MNVFIAFEEGYEHMKILGVSSSLELAWKRHNGEPDSFNCWRRVLACEIDSPNLSTHLFDSQKRISKGIIHTNPIKL